MKVVSNNTNNPVPLAIRLTAMNWEDPAKTSADINSVAGTEIPLATASVPKMIPNGKAPISIGTVSRAPRNRALVLADMGLTGRLRQYQNIESNSLSGPTKTEQIQL
ncbi:hypothetical protein GCM10007421_14790 [Halopseudomonas oceani]|nr:hypothetical protein GCM10007421_14790 [Halopseudomonas oceani]